jgi:hypothetical protein
MRHRQDSRNDPEFVIPEFVIPTSRAAAMEESAVTGSIDAACEQQIPPPSLSPGVGMTKHEEAVAAGTFAQAAL